MNLLDLSEDVICSNVVQTLSLGTLLNLLMTCKILYGLRKRCVANNTTCQELKEQLKDGLLGKLLNCHLNYMDFALYKEGDANWRKMENTFAILQTTDTFGSIGCMQSYCKNMMKNLFQYRVNYSYENNLLYSIFHRHNWQLCNITLFTFYEIFYHVHNRKYRNLQICLENLKFLGTKAYMFKTLGIAMDFLTYQHNKHLKAAMLYVIHEYINTILDDLFENFEDNSLFIGQVFNKKDEFVTDLMKMQRLPLYIKNMIKNKILVLNEEITKRKQILAV